MNIVQDIATLEDVDAALFHALDGEIVTYDTKDEAPVDQLFYAVFGVQPDKTYQDQLDKDLPRLRIIRKGGVQPGATGSAHGAVSFVVATVDGEDNPLTYDEVKGGSIGDISYDVRYISFHENDDRAIVAALTALFPISGIEIQGPENHGPFLFERQFHTDNLRRRKSELAGLFRIIARDICIGQRVTGQAAAITDLRLNLEVANTL